MKFLAIVARAQREGAGRINVIDSLSHRQRA